MKRYSVKASAAAIVMMFAVIITGCSSKEVVMKEFKSPDETVTIKLNEEWETEDKSEAKRS